MFYQFKTGRNTYLPTAPGWTTVWTYRNCGWCPPPPVLGRQPVLRMSLVIASQWKTLKLLCRFCISSVICRICVKLIQQPFLAETQWQQSKKMSHQHYPCTSPCAEICNVQDCFCRVVPCSFHHRTQPKSTKISACSIDPRCILDQAMSPSWYSMYSFLLQRQQGFLPVLSKWCHASIEWIHYC